jgi:hypothetical protein
MDWEKNFFLSGKESGSERRKPGGYLKKIPLYRKKGFLKEDFL